MGELTILKNQENLNHSKKTKRENSPLVLETFKYE